MVLKYFYPAIPSIVRIKSESLCMDHTFIPRASTNIVSFKDLFELLKSKYIDSVFVFVQKEADAYYICPINNEKISIYGWTDLSIFDAVEHYPPAEDL